MKELKQLCDNFHEMWENFNSMVHSCSYHGADSFTPYEPSRFVYAFFFLNAMANYDWKRSFEVGNPVLSRGRDKPKIEALCKFVLDNATEDLRDDFVEKMKTGYSRERINNLTKGIILDERVTKAEKQSVVGGLLDIMISEVTFHSIKNVLSYVYEVRCNVFHGSKDLGHIDDPQIIRIKLYADFLEAFNKLAVDTIMMHSNGQAL